MTETIITHSIAETEQAGRVLAEHLKHTAELSAEMPFVALRGDLGAGKTVFVRGFASAISPGSRVKSPTYTIVNEYLRGSVPLYHFDLYRTGGGDELESFGFDEYIAHGICIVEWSEYMDKLPDGAVVVTISSCGENDRKITLDYPSETSNDNTCN